MLRVRSVMTMIFLTNILKSNLFRDINCIFKTPPTWSTHIYQWERNSYDSFLAKFSCRRIQTPLTYLAVGELNCAKSFSLWLAPLTNWIIWRLLLSQHKVELKLSIIWTCHGPIALVSQREQFLSFFKIEKKGEEKKI